MIRHSLIAIAISSIIALPVAAGGINKSAEHGSKTTMQSDHAKLSHKADNATLSLTGTVTDATRDGFVLDYGKGRVNVEMNEREWYGRDFQTLEGSQVTVLGQIDDDWVKRRSIEADSVFTKHTQTLHRSASADSIESTLWLIPPGGAQSNWIRGEVSGIDPAERVIRLRSTGGLSFDVGIANLPFDPIDGDKPFDLDIGDQVILTGELLSDPAERHRVLDATSLVLLADDAPADLVSSAGNDD